MNKKAMALMTTAMALLIITVNGEGATWVIQQVTIAAMFTAGLYISKD